MNDKLTELVAKVKDCVSPKDAATVLVTGVADTLDGLTHDPVAIKALSDDLRASAAVLGDAVIAGTNKAYADPHKEKWEGTLAKSPKTK